MTCPIVMAALPRDTIRAVYFTGMDDKEDVIDETKFIGLRSDELVFSGLRRQRLDTKN